MSVRTTTSACVAILACLVGCNPDDATTPGDTTPPAAVDDLGIALARGRDVELTWTAPGDDGTEGRASAYDVRISRQAISEASWDSAQAVEAPAPRPAGEAETLVLDDLELGTWYAALETADEVPNWSGLSNVASATLTALPDTLPPAAVSDLAIVSATSGEVSLSWTATGDDGTEGRATAVDLRYALSEITDATWEAALEAEGEPAPDSVGAEESFTVSDLEAETTYFFALRVADEVPNTSALSNVASATTLPDTIPPAAVTDLATLSATATSVTLGWSAPGDDGAEGQAAVYDVRYALTAITEETWDDAVAVKGEPVPSAAGTAESFEVPNLTAGTAYSFGLRSADEVPNWSPLSNVVTASPDTVAPSAVTNLAATFATTSSVTLSWTAPGDDGTEGQASAYDLRYALGEITEATWADAEPVADVPAPGPAGTAESFSVTGLDAVTTYAFALKTADETPRWSALSNVVTEATVSLVRLTVSPGFSFGARNPTWSPDGAYIAFHADWIRPTPHDQVYVLPAAGRDAVQLTGDEDYARDPSWSPDGEKIAFTTHRYTGDPYEEQRSGIWVQDAEPFAMPTLIAQHGDGQFTYGSSWSPDGAYIVYSVWTALQSPYYDIRVVPSNGGPSTRIAGNSKNIWPRWSPDGTRIVFESNRDGDSDIWTMDPGGGSLSQVTDDPAWDGQPAWSPDGSRIAFASDRSGNGDIWTVPVAGGEATPVTTDPADDGHPSWSPDGRAIAFQSNRTGPYEIWVTAVDAP